MSLNLATPEVIPVLPAEYQATASNEYFPIGDCGVGDQERIFIFASESRIPFLAESVMQMEQSRFVQKYVFSCIPFMCKNEAAIFPVLFDYYRTKRKECKREFLGK